MNIIILADLHGNFPPVLPDHDIVCIAGDILAGNNIYDLENWFYNITDKPILWIPGNHDIPLKGWNSKIRRVRCLHGNTITINGIKFGGFVWNNCASEPELADVFAYSTVNAEKLKKEIGRLNPCDVLLSHSPPFGILDANHGEVEIGVPGLFDWAKANCCCHIFCGHVHEQGGKVYTQDGITVINAARRMMTTKI